MKRLFGIAAGIGAVLLAGVVQAELKVGDAAPDFALKGSDGKTHRLSDYRGKQPVVIAWFPKAFTGGWTAECNSLRASGIEEGFTVTLLGNRKFEVKPSKGSGLDKFDVAYFTASCDDAETNRKYAEALKLDYPILSDPDHKTAEAFGVLRPNGFASRVTFFIGKDGKVLFIDKDVQAGSHADAIKAKLKELGVSQK